MNDSQALHRWPMHAMLLQTSDVGTIENGERWHIKPFIGQVGRIVTFHLGTRVWGALTCTSEDSVSKGHTDTSAMFEEEAASLSSKTIAFRT